MSSTHSLIPTFRTRRAPDVSSSKPVLTADLAAHVRPDFELAWAEIANRVLVPTPDRINDDCWFWEPSLAGHQAVVRVTGSEPIMVSRLIYLIFRGDLAGKEQARRSFTCRGRRAGCISPQHAYVPSTLVPNLPEGYHRASVPPDPISPLEGEDEG